MTFGHFVSLQHHEDHKNDPAHGPRHGPLNRVLELGTTKTGSLSGLRKAVIPGPNSCGSKRSRAISTRAVPPQGVTSSTLTIGPAACGSSVSTGVASVQALNNEELEYATLSPQLSGERRGDLSGQ